MAGINNANKAGMPSNIPPVTGQKVGPSTKPLRVVAQEVIRGEWGNGQERIEKLKAAGYDPAKVQDEVNKQMK
ncbi:MAG: hypothetical protein IKD66_01900 [Solobacterium sp.]|nr:hypothetical protein [Solobacterium sp.]